MYFDQGKKCFLNDDGTRLGSSESIMTWTDRKYILWLRAGLANGDEDIIDNSWLWDNRIKYSTLWEDR